MHKFDLASLLACIVGVASLATSAAFAGYVSTLFGPAAPQVIAGIGAAGLIASQVLRIIGSPSTTTSTQEAPKS